MANTTKEVAGTTNNSNTVKGHNCNSCPKFHKWPKFVYKYYDIPIMHVCECGQGTKINNGRIKRLKVKEYDDLRGDFKSVSDHVEKYEQEYKLWYENIISNKMNKK